MRPWLNLLGLPGPLVFLVVAGISATWAFAPRPYAVAATAALGWQLLGMARRIYAGPEAGEEKEQGQDGRPHLKDATQRNY